MIWIDYAMLALVSISALLGLSRGLIQETLSLVSWLAALWVGFRFHPALTVRLDIVPHPAFRAAAAFVLLFLSTLIVGKLLSFLTTTLIEQTPLAYFNRLGGLVFGACRGIVLMLVLVLAARNFQLNQTPWWHESRLLPYLEQWVSWLEGIGPEVHLPRLL